MKSMFRVFMFFLMTISALAGDVNIKKLPSLLAGSNAGTEYYLSFPPCYDEESPGGDNSLRIFVASGVRQEVVVEVEGKGYSVSKFTVPNDVIEFRLSPNIGQPYIKDAKQVAPVEQVYQKAAVHVKSKAPIIVYGMTRYQYTSDGFLAIPVSVFGTEYVVASYPQYAAAGSTYELPSLSNIVAAYDDTEITFTMGGTSGSKTTGGLRKGQKATFSMNKGDVVCFANNGAAGDVAGSLVKSNKPVGVISGNQCANVPSGVYACDYMSEMELPTFTWGKEYHVTPIFGRQKAPVIRIFAKEKDTKVYRDGQDWMRLTLNSRGEGDAFIERRAFDGSLNDLLNQGGTPCKVVSADKPIYVMLYNPGQTDDNVVSDPFQMVLTPLEQYQKEIVFATPYAKGGTLPFTRQYVNLIYENTSDGAIPDDLEFATVVNGKFTWKKVSVQFGPAPGFKFAVPVRGKTYSMKRLQLSGDGLFRIRSSAPFAAYAYGFSNYDSYGFPTSVALVDLEKQDTLSPNPKWKVLCDGSVVGDDGSGIANVTDKPDDTNFRSNLALIYMDLDSSYNYEFDFDKNRTFIAGTTVGTDWSLTVIDPSKDARACIAFVDRAGNDTIIEVKYTALPVDIINKDTDFGECQIGEQLSKSIDLVNKDTNTTVIVKNINLKNGGQGFTILNTSFPIEIPPGGKVSLQISFKNMTKGEFRDTLLLQDSCVIVAKGTLKAFIGEPVLNVSNIDFGTIKRGAKVIRSLIVTNEGDMSLTITGHTLSKDSTVFRLVNWPVINSKNPLMLRPNENREFEIEFTAVNPLEYNESLVFHSNARTQDSIVELQGNGIEGKLIARGADWGRKRADYGPYLDPKGIILENIGNDSIRILSSSLPDTDFVFDKNIFNGMTLQPNQSIEVKAIFSPTIIGNDSLIVTFETDLGKTESTNPPLRGTGIIGQVISVSDIDFGTIRKGTKIIQPLIVKNEGDATLTITGYTIPKDPAVFRLVNWPVIDAQNPLILEPNFSRVFEVEFTAVDAVNHTEAIVFSSDARTRDSIGELKGRGIEGSLLARGADWGRKRIGNGPYVDRKGIILENIGNGPIRILSSSLPDADFAFDKNVFNGMTLQPNQVIEVEAAFSPTVIGNDNLVVTFETDLGTSVPTDPPLRGAGIIGQLQTQDYDFDSTIIQGNVKPANRKMIRITNIGTLDGAGADYSDDVIITDILSVSPGSISETNARYGTEGFKYSKPSLMLPRVLKKGDYLEFQAEFQAQKFGRAMAEVQIESDASNPAIINKWTGFGIDPFRPDPKIDPKGGSVNNICVGSSGDIIATIKNIGNVKFPVLNVFINPATATEFVIDATSKAALLATNLELDETRNVKIGFSPVGAPGSRTVQMGVVGPTVDDTVYVDIVGLSVTYITTLEVKNSTTLSTSTKTNFDIGLKTAPSSIANVRSLPLTFHYDPDIFSPSVNEISLAGAYANANYRIVNARLIKEGEIYLTIEAVGATTLIDKSGDIISIPMNVTQQIDSIIKTEIEVKAMSVGCITVLPAKNTFTIEGAFQDDFSPFKFIQKGSELEISILNPTISQTRLQIYNLKGQLIQEDDLGIIDRKSITYQAGNFTPGTYIVRVLTDLFTIAKVILISE
ncbi:MAG: hypothetical protein RL734_1428 [Bacteroidota bacterium]